MTTTISQSTQPTAAASTETAISPVSTVEQSSESASALTSDTSNRLLAQWQRLLTAVDEWREEKGIPALPEGTAAKVMTSLQVGRDYIRGRSFADFAVWFTVAHITVLALAIIVGPNSMPGTVASVLALLALTGAVLKATELIVEEMRCRVVPYFQRSGTDA